MRSLVGWSMVALLGGAACSAVAASPTHPCASVTEASARLQCYDAAFPPVLPTAEEASERAQREFGLNPAQIESRDPTRARDTGPDRIQASVTAVDYRPGGERIVTLDNGQVWRLTEATIRGALGEGDEVTVRKGAFSSFMLVTPAGVALRARRVR